MDCGHLHDALVHVPLNLWNPTDRTAVNVHNAQLDAPISENSTDYARSRCVSSYSVLPVYKSLITITSLVLLELALHTKSIVGWTLSKPRFMRIK